MGWLSPTREKRFFGIFPVLSLLYEVQLHRFTEQFINVHLRIVLYRRDGLLNDNIKKNCSQAKAYWAVF